jgi:DNA-binding transcriptional ArsR family regulator
MTTPQFDELIHAPTRLAIVALLAATDWSDFAFIRDSVGLSDSALSKQLSTLEVARYVQIRRSFVGKRPRTSARLSPEGRVAFNRHVAALQQIVAAAGLGSVRAQAESRAPRPVLRPQPGAR